MKNLADPAEASLQGISAEDFSARRKLKRVRRLQAISGGEKGQWEHVVRRSARALQNAFIISKLNSTRVQQTRFGKIALLQTS
ncbi:hypothetical protein SAMN05421753_106109 [Planctomicrobium piriforme]|uniref:Uncharacterized protein n=1 Tax=Planctomicrobium piriforme TaxID=1576369 RepID=A0A1I3G0N8_9PLAN|nr:hypothetical protein SAMN05421753_106109 [Planctomicrobium piriforme]